MFNRSSFRSGLKDGTIEQFPFFQRMTQNLLFNAFTNSFLFPLQAGTVWQIVNFARVLLICNCLGAPIFRQKTGAKRAFYGKNVWVPKQLR